MHGCLPPDRSGPAAKRPESVQPAGGYKQEEWKMDDAKRKAGRPKSANPKNVNVGLRMTDEQYQKLKAYAEKSGETVSKVLLEALEAYIK